MPSRPVQVRFLNPREIRMGSPFLVGQVALSGPWVPELPDLGLGFQDLSAWSPSANHLALVRWDIDGAGEPGFRILIVDFRRQSLSQSPRLSGCCQSLAWSEGGFAYQTLRNTGLRSLERASETAHIPVEQES